MKCEIILNEENEYDDNSCTIVDLDDNFRIDLTTKKNGAFIDLINDKSIFFDAIEREIEFLIEDEENREEEIKKYDELKDKVSTIFDNTEYVVLNFEDIDILDYIEKNPILKSKKIVLHEIITINDYDRVKELLTKYDKYKDNIYVVMKDNSGYVKLTDCLEPIIQIKTQAEAIKSLNLSPIETIMYAYDQVRNRVYTYEDESDSPTISRNLNSVLNGEKIVCAGYANIFDSLLNYMGFRCMNVGLVEKKDKGSGHQRNSVYVKDEKYDIDGVYFFDTTWDSKRSYETNEFLNSYKHFAKTMNEMKELECNQFDYDEYPYDIKTIDKDAKKIFKNNVGINKINSSFSKTVNHMVRMALGRSSVIYSNWQSLSFGRIKPEECGLYEELEETLKKFNNPISAEKFIKILSNVRKIEYYQNPKFYPYTINHMFETYFKSKWNFEQHHYSPQERILMLMYGKKHASNRRDVVLDFEGYSHSLELEKEIEQIKLTKALQETCKKR